MAFKVNNPDYNLSPYTGMTREHWVDSGKFLIEGVLQHVKDFNSPIVLPKQHEVTYPKDGDPEWKFKSAEYEGLARTFMTAAPVIANDPNWETNGYNVRDYYAKLILSSTNPKSPNYLWKVSELKEKYGSHQHYQHTVEGAALVIGLMASKKEIWDKYTKEEKDQVADFLTDYAHNRTLSHNWRYFNVMMLSFLKLNGYSIDETALKDHMQNLMTYYTGDGWYRDHLDFDYYIPWAFNFYGPMWCNWYGYEHEPEIAEIIEKRHFEFMKSYLNFYSRQGHQFMWGRSIVYRCAASAAIGSAFLLKNTSADAGWARRVASGNLLQFLTRDDMFYQGVPCLGYYRSWEPMVQFYSCAASPFWLSKTYIALSVPQDSPFWTAKENEGIWSGIGQDVKTTILKSPGLQVTNYGKNGTSEVRPGKVLNKLPYYNRICYNTDFLWEDDAPEGGTAMTYSLKEHGSDKEFTVPLRLGFVREKDGVLYRQFNMGMGDDYFGPTRVDLADIPLKKGTLRVDRLKIGPKHELHLGHFGLPHYEDKKPEIKHFEVDGNKAISASINNKKLAIVALNGWGSVESIEHKGKNPETDESTVIYAKREKDRDYPGMELLVTIMLHDVEGNDFTDEDLNPIKSIDYIDWSPSNSPCGAKIELKDGRKFEVDFGDLEGEISF